MPKSLRVAAAASTLLVAVAALAQHADILQRFPLNQAIPESAITACLSQEVPIRVNTLMAEGNELEAAKAFEDALVAGNCINGAGLVTYTRLVHRLDAQDGSVWTVYQGRAGRVTFYVPMHGYLHEDRFI